MSNIWWIDNWNSLCIIQCSSSTSCHLQIALLDWKFEAVADWIFSSAGQYFHHYHWGCWGCWICFKRIKRPALEATAEMSNVKCVLIKRQNIYAMPDAIRVPLLMQGTQTVAFFALPAGCSFSSNCLPGHGGQRRWKEPTYRLINKIKR